VDPLLCTPTGTPGTQYTADDVVFFTDSKYYKAINDLPDPWTSVTQYGLGSLVLYSGTFYESVATAPTIGTEVVLELSGVVGSFTVGSTVEQVVDAAASPPEVVTGTVVAWDNLSNDLTVSLDDPNGQFQVLSPASPIKPSSTIADWQAGVAYTTGDVVRYNGSFWEAATDIPDTSPDQPAPGTVSPTDWTFLNNETTATVDAVVEPNPATNTDQWAVTVKADPVTDSGNYWELFEDFDPTKDNGVYWEVYTDRDPGISGSTYWVAFIPTGEEPSSADNFSVNKISRSLPSGLPYTFQFVGPYAEANANDFAVVVGVDMMEVWENWMTKRDTFSETEVVVFPPTDICP
jgi:hypothetical protein